MTPSDEPSSERAESWTTIWGRRALTVPITLALAALYLTLLPALVLVALVADLATGRASVLPRSRATLAFALYLACEVVGIVGALALGVGTLGGRLVAPARYLAWNASLQRGWTNALFFGSVRLFGMRVETEGLEHARRGPLLLFVRHTSTADTVLTAALVANPHRLLLRYVLKRELLWDPCLDLVGRRLPNAFVARGRSTSKATAPRAVEPGRPSSDGSSSPEIRAVASLARDLDAGSAVLIYPEGTRFSEAKRDRAVANLRERGNTELAARAAGFRHVLPPRLGGPLALLEAAPDVDVVVVEHTGFEGAATFAEWWGGGLVGTTVRVRLRRFPAASIPREARATWLYDRWAEVDGWVETHGASSADAPREAAPTRDT